MTRAAIALTITITPILAFLVASPALACGHSMRLRLDPEAEMMRVVRQDIRRHRYRSAARAILKTWPKIRTAVAQRAVKQPRRRHFSPFIRSNPAANLRRARVAMATAVVRTNGRLNARHGWSGDSPRKRLRDLRWAARVLRDERARSPRNVLVQSRLAEALSRLPSTRAEAWMTLNNLADQRTIPEAMGYAALADLRAEVGDGPGRNAALRQCRRLGASARSCRRYLGKRTLHVAALDSKVLR